MRTKISSVSSRALFSTVLFLSGQLTLAQTPSPTPVPEPTGPAQFTVTPDTLRERTMTSSLNVLSSLENINAAKIKVDASRAALLPSLNISALASGNFISAGISILLPFLLPGNYFNLAGSKNLLMAQGESFNAGILNLYASTESAYLAVVGDQKSEQALEDQLAALESIVQIVQYEVNLKIANETDLPTAQTAYDDEKTLVLNARLSFETEVEAMRNYLNLPLSTTFVWQDVSVAASPYENSTADELLNQAIQLAPENTQLIYLLAAGKDATWSAGFSWLGSALLNQSINGQGAPTSASGTINLGFGIFPTINLAKQNVDSLVIQQRQLVSDTSETLAEVLEQVSIAKQQVTVANDALSNAQASYDGTLWQYRLGTTDLLHVLQAHQALTTNILQQIQAKVTLNVSRVSLHRAMITDQFKMLPVCDTSKVAKNINIFKESLTSIEQLCGLAPIK